MTARDGAPVHDVDPPQAAALVADGALLLDVREPDEWTAGHAEEAVHMPLGALDPAALPDTTIVAVCRSGNRSSKAAVILSAAGHDVVNLAGGMTAWAERGLPLVTDDGRPGTVA